MFQSLPVLKLFVVSMKVRSPAVLEFVTLPCLRILNHLIQPDPPTSKKHKVAIVCMLLSLYKQIYF